METKTKVTLVLVGIILLFVVITIPQVIGEVFGSIFSIIGDLLDTGKKIKLPIN